MKQRFMAIVLAIAVMVMANGCTSQKALPDGEAEAQRRASEQACRAKGLVYRCDSLRSHCACGP